MNSSASTVIVTAAIAVAVLSLAPRTALCETEPLAQADESNKPGVALVRSEREVKPCFELFGPDADLEWSVACDVNATATARREPLKIGRSTERPLAIRAAAKDPSNPEGRWFAASATVAVPPQPAATHLLVECGADRFVEGGWGALAAELESGGGWIAAPLAAAFENRGGVIATYALPLPEARERAFGRVRIVAGAPTGGATFYVRRIALVAAPAESARSLAAETLSEPTRLRLYPYGTDVSFRIRGAAGEPLAKDVLRWKVVDWRGCVRHCGNAPFSATEWRDGLVVTVPAAKLGSGYFELRLRLASDGATLPRSGTRPAGFESFGILPDMPIPTLAHGDDSRFGVQGTVRAYNEPGHSPLYEMMGWRWVYENARPFSAQPSREPEFVPPSDAEILARAGNDDHAKHGYASLVNMHGLPPWLVEKPADVPDAAVLADPTRVGQKYPIADPVAYTELLRRLMETEARRRSLLRPHLARGWYELHWEPDWHWGGTDEQFIEFYRCGREAMDAADPGAVLTAANYGVIDKGNALLERLFKKGLGRYVNGITTHLYLLRPDWPEGAGLDLEVRRLRALADQYIGPGAPIINTEGGTEFKGNPAVLDDLREHAARLARGHLIALGEGCTATTFFYTGDYGAYSPTTVHYGMFFNQDTQGRAFGPDSISPKPAGMAVAAMIRLLEGTVSEGRVDGLGEGVYAYAFRRGDTRILAIWSPGGTRDVAPDVPQDAVLFDMMGNGTTLRVTGGRAAFAADPNPCYVAFPAL